MPSLQDNESRDRSGRDGRGNRHAAYDSIRSAIVEGRYKPGQRLVEQRIAEEFDVSRTPVREALRRLEAEGLVSSEPDRGAVVRDLSIDDVADLYGLRARLEAYAADLAADRIDQENLALLDAGIEEFSGAFEQDRELSLDAIRAVNLANRKIHEAIIEGAHHDRLSRLLERTVDVPLVFQAFRQFDRAEVERSHLFHQLIRDAISRGDGNRASALMFEHIMQGCDVLLSHLQASDAEVENLFDS